MYPNPITYWIPVASCPWKWSRCVVVGSNGTGFPSSVYSTSLGRSAASRSIASISCVTAPGQGN